MTVGELIAALQLIPSELEVITIDGENRWTEVTTVYLSLVEPVRAVIGTE